MTVQVTTLDNGLRVATDTMNSVETASVGVWVGAGTRDEAPEINGVSHLLEHMAFKGSKVVGTKDYVAEVSVFAKLDAQLGHLRMVGIGQ